MLLFASSAILAQDEEARKNYTYVEDKRFMSIHDLNNYTFVPNEEEIPDWGKESIAEGKVQIHVTQSSVYFKGIQDLESYSIISKNPSKTGYNLELMDARNPGRMAIMKIVTDDDLYAHLIYIYSKDFGELTYFLPLKPQAVLERERNFYTQKTDVIVRSYASLVGTEIIPFEWVDEYKKGYNKAKLSSMDNISIQFEDEKIIYNKGEQVKDYTIKKAKTSEFKNKNQPHLTYLVEIQVEEVGEDFKVYLNKYNLIEVIEIRGSHFFLMN